ncbi:MAG TPA: HDIG domain-containing protein [Gemmatimonadales bacterium]|nr:HDIG domain-containing protein [Gemmatimonadales bacterium]
MVSGRRFLREPERVRSLGARLVYHGVRWAPLVAVAVLAHAVFPSPIRVGAPTLQVGQVAEKTVTSPFQFVVLKSEAERALEGEARAMAARPVYRFDGAAYDSVLAQIDTFFARVGVAAQEGPAEVQRTAMEAGARLGRPEAEFLLEADRRRSVHAALTDFLAAMLAQGIADAGTLRAEPSRLIALRRGDAERVAPRDSILTFVDLMARVEGPHAGVTDEIGRRAMRQLTAAFYRPTIVFDPWLTRLRRDEVRLSVDSVKHAVSAGERIVVAGQAVTQEARDKLLGLQKELRRRGEDAVATRAVVGGILYNAIILSTFWLLMLLYRRESYDRLREMAFFGVLFGLVVLLAASLTQLFPWRPELSPIPFAAILIATLYNGRTAVFGVFVLAILLGGQWALRESHTVLFGVVGGVAAALSMRVLRRRWHIWVSIGLMAGAFTLAAITAGLVEGWSTATIVTTAISGSIVGLSSASFALLVVPLAESVTGITTDLTLLELSDLSRPLLKRMATEAPGTWAHSLAMANLCETACTAIGANGLLARVGCYYHDIGKLSNPQFFIENQSPGNNPHDTLLPEESARIIRDHVAHGLALADEAVLPPVVRAFIPEHHGTTEINYFLHRARRQAGGAEIDVGNFRYPGPRPRSAETAVTMLADSTEAAIRVLEDPTPAQLREAIGQLIQQKLLSRQLEEAPLTLRDLDRITDEFWRTLAGMYHNRVPYPRASGEREAELQPVVPG